jgi:hypothetical protein
MKPLSLKAVTISSAVRCLSLGPFSLRNLEKSITGILKEEFGATVARPRPVKVRARDLEANFNIVVG